MSEQRTPSEDENKDESAVAKATEWLNEKLYPILGPPPIGPYETHEERRENEHGTYPQEAVPEASDEQALHQHADLDGQVPGGDTDDGEDRASHPDSPEMNP